MKILFAFLYLTVGYCTGTGGFMRVGGPVQADVNSHEISEVTNTALTLLNSQDNSNREIVQVLKAQTQVCF